MSAYPCALRDEAANRVRIDVHQRTREDAKPQGWKLSHRILELLSRKPDDSYVLGFKSGQLEIRVREVDNPVIEGVECRITILVDSLTETGKWIEESRIEFERISPTV